jgi:hypothetical protein
MVWSYRRAMREEAADRVNIAFFELFPPVGTLDPETARAYFRFLLEVTAVVFQFLTLIPMQQAMTAEGVHSRRIFGSGVSNDLAKFVPEALVGRLSGIKVYFQQGSKGWTLKLKYVSFASAPRLLLYRLASLLEEEGCKGPAVLLASATSFLHDSPSYHIPVGPHFVLRRENEIGAWNRSEYIFSPVPDPLVLFEDADVPGVRFFRKPPNLHLLSTVGMLRGLERVGIIRSADEVIQNMTHPTDPSRRARDLPDGVNEPATIGSSWTPNVLCAEITGCSRSGRRGRDWDSNNLQEP